jgi:hypothetical protein
MRKFFFVLTLVTFLGLSIGAFAATVQTPTVSFTINSTQDLAIDNETVSITTPEVADYDAEYTKTASNTLTVKSNQGWKLSVKATSSDLGTSGSYTKPLADFEWKEASGTFASISSTDAEVKTGTATAGEAVTVTYRAKLSWTADIPGNYSVDLTYTLVAN